MPATDDEDNTTTVIKILEFPWRNPRVREFFDAVDARIRYNQQNEGDTQQRLRRLSAVDLILSDRPAPAGLPEDWYDAEWLEKLKKNDELGYVELRPAPAANTQWDTLIKYAPPHLLCKTYSLLQIAPSSCS
jgi:hypothetical protein